MVVPRPVCWHCRRPASVCWCAALVPVVSAARVVILQHPRERRVAIGTGRMTHLSLPNSELHVGIDFAAHGRVRMLARRGVLLFPGADAVAPDRMRASAPSVLVVLDGTWSQARTLFRRNAFLHELPRLAFTPRQPSEYRIRKEPSPECWSTIEAVAYTLGQLEDDPGRFASLLEPFRRLIRMQVACGAVAQATPSTHPASADTTAAT